MQPIKLGYFLVILLKTTVTSAMRLIEAKLLHFSLFSLQRFDHIVQWLSFIAWTWYFYGLTKYFYGLNHRYELLWRNEYNMIITSQVSCGSQWMCQSRKYVFNYVNNYNIT